jgi:GT2 family glycosyltransferase
VKRFATSAIPARALQNAARLRGTPRAAVTFARHDGGAETMAERQPGETQSPRVSVVLITRDRREEALASVARLLALPDDLQVIVVDNASSDGTPDALLRSFPSVRVIPLERNRGAAGRNVGVQEARARYVAFADDDSGWEAGSLTRAASLLDEHSGVGLLAARLLVGEDRRDDPLNDGLRDSPLEPIPGLPGIPVLGFVACASVVRREAFLEVGGFEERFVVGGEEELFALDLSALGWQLLYVDELLSFHLPSDQRDGRLRRRRLVRNALWTTWLRRRGAGVASGTREALRGALADADGWEGTLEALGGLPWVIRRRRRLPPRVELERRRLEQRRPPRASST